MPEPRVAASGRHGHVIQPVLHNSTQVYGVWTKDRWVGKGKVGNVPLRVVPKGTYTCRQELSNAKERTKMVSKCVPSPPQHNPLFNYTSRPYFRLYHFPRYFANPLSSEPDSAPTIGNSAMASGAYFSDAASTVDSNTGFVSASGVPLGSEDDEAIRLEMQEFSQPSNNRNRWLSRNLTDLNLRTSSREQRWQDALKHCQAELSKEDFQLVVAYKSPEELRRAVDAMIAKTQSANVPRILRHLKPHLGQIQNFVVGILALATLPVVKTVCIWGLISLMLDVCAHQNHRLTWPTLPFC